LAGERAVKKAGLLVLKMVDRTAVLMAGQMAAY
jgi:hypothetical protein